MEEIILPKFSCLRCGHTWYPRREVYPTVCPRCKSPYWDKERKNKRQSGHKKNGTDRRGKISVEQAATIEQHAEDTPSLWVQ